MNIKDILETDSLILRALEPEDVNLLFLWENNRKIWPISSTICPFSKHILEEYIANSHKDIYEVKQLRLMIVEHASNTTIGTIDLYEFDPVNLRAGIGIFIVEEYQNKGFASQTIECLEDYAKNVLNLHQLYAEVPSFNIKGIQLFEALHYTKTAIKKDWLKNGANFYDQILFQKIL